MRTIKDRLAIRRTYVDKLIGDEAMLLIPAPRLQAMQDAANLARALSWHPLYVAKFGAHWGQVVLADAGLPVGPKRPEAFSSVTVLGPTVNIASRVIKFAENRELATVAQPLDGQEVPLLMIALHHVTQDDINVVPANLRGIADEPVAVQRTRFRPFEGAEKWIDIDEHVCRWIELGGAFPSLD